MRAAVVVVISILHLVSASAVPQAFGKDGPPGSARVGKGDPPADAAAVAAAERAFAKLAEEKGVRDAFVATAAEVSPLSVVQRYSTVAGTRPTDTVARNAGASPSGAGHGPR